MNHLIDLATNGWPALIAFLAVAGIWLAKRFGFLSKGRESEGEGDGGGEEAKDSESSLPPRRLTQSQTKELYDERMEEATDPPDSGLSDIDSLREELRAGHGERKQNIERLRRLLDEGGGEGGERAD